MLKVYLAGPYGFSEIGRSGIVPIIKELEKYVIVLNPFEKANEFGKQIHNLEQEITNKASNKSFIEFQQKCLKISQEIGKQNESLIRESDLVLAILDGSDVDSGTAAEIGYAFGIGKKIFGYRSDFRYAGDNLGSKINLQVNYFLNSRGGIIFQSFEEIKIWLINLGSK